MKLHRPSPTFVISIMALVIATSGTAFAAGHYMITSGSEIKPGAITLRDLSKGARKALHGATGPRGPAGQNGQNGQPGAAGTARAFGLVGPDGGGTWGLETSAPNRDIAAVTNPNPGATCITLADGTTASSSTIIATPDYRFDDTTFGGPDSPQAVVEVSDPTSVTCPAGSFEVLTWERTVTANGSGDVTNDELTAANEGFSFIVP